MTLISVIAEAWARERAKYVIAATKVRRWGLVWMDGSNLDSPIVEGRYEACQAHLDALCAKAVCRALRAQGLALIEDRYMRDNEPPDLMDETLGETP